MLSPTALELALWAATVHGEPSAERIALCAAHLGVPCEVVAAGARRLRDSFDTDEDIALRVQALAHSLTSRSSRRRAFALATGVCVSSGSLSSLAMEFLWYLQEALEIDDDEADVVLAEARSSFPHTNTASQGS